MGKWELSALTEVLVFDFLLGKMTGVTSENPSFIWRGRRCSLFGVDGGLQG